jgi:hypothetical protein
MSLFCSVHPLPSVSFRLLAFAHKLQTGYTTGSCETLGALLHSAAAHLYNMGNSDMAARVMAVCARLQYAVAPQSDITCAMGSIVAAQGLQHDLVAHAPVPVVFSHGLHALHAASSLGIEKGNGRSSPAPNILAMTLKQFGSAARFSAESPICAALSQ